MALIKCSECGKEISDKAESCPHCGCPVSKMEISQTTAELKIENNHNEAKPHKNKKPFYLRVWFIVVAIVIFVVVIVASIIIIPKFGEKIVWSELVLGEMLPEPPASRGEIYDNTGEELDLKIYKGISDEQFKAYVNQCKERGFTVDIYSNNDSFTYNAHNEQGYKLSLEHSSYDANMYIELTAPMVFTQIQWPAGVAGELLPIPDSTIGKFNSERENRFDVYIGNTTESDYNEYIIACQEGGFIVDYDKSDRRYRARNEDGWRLILEYVGYNIMHIDIDPPDEEVEEIEENEPEEVLNSETDYQQSEPSESEDTSFVDSDEKENTDSYSPYEDAILMCKILKEALYNPNSLQIHNVFYVERYGTYYYYLDYSAMNQLGGYTRNVYVAEFINSIPQYMVCEDDTGYPDSVNYKIAIEVFEENISIPLDVDLIESNL